MMIGAHAGDLAILSTKEQQQCSRKRILSRDKTTPGAPACKLLGMAIERPAPPSCRLQQQTAIVDLTREHGPDNCKPTLLPCDPSLPVDQASTEHPGAADASAVRSILESDVTMQGGTSKMNIKRWCQTLCRR